MDAYSRLLIKARETVEVLLQRGITAIPHISDEGMQIAAWSIETISRWDKEEHYGKSLGFREAWGHTDLVLGVDGNIYRYHDAHEERDGGFEKHTRSLELQTPRSLGFNIKRTSKLLDNLQDRGY